MSEQVKFVPFEKKSKKAQRAENAQKRGSWGGINPVTRRPDPPKAYSRNKVKAIIIKRMNQD